MNPFLKEETAVSDFDGYYSDAVFSQVAEIMVGDSLKVELLGKSASDFRMTLRYLSDKNRVGKFRTKKAKDGSLWIKRIS
jgi:hypothetical protein